MSPRKHTRLIILFSIVSVALFAYLSGIFSGPDLEHSAKKSAEKLQEEKKVPAVTNNSSINTDDAPFEKESSNKNLMSQFLEFRKNPSEEAVKRLYALLDHTETEIALEAIDTLGHMAMNSELSAPIMEILIKRAADMNYPHHGHALLIGSIAGKEMMLPVVSQYVSENDKTDAADYWQYEYASRALAIIGGPASVSLTARLLDLAEDSRTRKTCYETLAGAATPESISLLTGQMLSSDGADQIHSAVALSRLNNPEQNTLLADSISENRFSEATVINLAVSSAAPAIFGKLLNSGATPDAKKIEYLNIIKENSTYGSPEVRKELFTILSDLLTAGNDEINIHALTALGMMRVDNISEVVVPYLSAEDSRVRKSALDTFGSYISPQNYTALYNLLWDQDSDIRRASIVHLERFVNIDDRPVLEKAAQHEDAFIRKHAAALLAQID